MFLSTSELSVPRKTQSSYCVCVCVLPNLLKKHSQYFSLLNYCNSSIKMEIASSAHGGLERV